MKSALIKLVLAIGCASLIVGCSSNTQRENTFLGAGTGAVAGGALASIGSGSGLAIGAGAVVGALIGGMIGNSMDSSDKARCYYVLRHKHKHHSMHWKNPKTGHAYNMTPTSKMMTFNGNPNCRTYVTTDTFNGKTQQYSGTACLQADGSWLPMKA